MNWINRIVNLGLMLSLVILAGFQTKEPWTAKQMLSPYALNQILQNTDEPQPVLLSVGPEAVIKGSLDMGAGQHKASIERLKKELAKLPKDTDIVIYCGCCPLQKCPNVRPAFTTLTELGFENHKLLAILNNIKTDWIDKGYPTQAPN